MVKTLVKNAVMFLLVDVNIWYSTNYRIRNIAKWRLCEDYGGGMEITRRKDYKVILNAKITVKKYYLNKRSEIRERYTPYCS